jgi:hypothetical protein
MAAPQPAALPPVLALVPVPPAPQNQVKNGFHTKTWGDGSKYVGLRLRPSTPVLLSFLRPTRRH